MPKDRTDAERTLHKLGQLVRQGFAKKHPTPEKSLETIRDAVRKQYEQEQKAEREKKPTPDTGKDQHRQPPEPDHER